MLLLLDGLDEVCHDNDRRVIKAIRQFSELFHNNQFLLTCRIAAQEYVFENFTEVEVADFDDQQIAIFATKWFAQKDPTKTERFLRKLRDNSRVKELATNPLLLTLLCLGFEEVGYLDSSRSGLYKEGLDVLLKKWDAKRNIERGEIYQHLKLERKQELLSQLAHNTFFLSNYFFKQEVAETEIRQYIVNLPESPTDPRQLELDSEQVLKAIVAQHGLLIERAAGIYSFSHLTFHEYFTASKIVRSLNLENELSKLVNQIHEKRWREVLLLTAEMLPQADRLLILMKENIDALLAKDQKLQALLFWAESKSAAIKEPYKRAAIHAYYLALSFELSLQCSYITSRNYAFSYNLSFDLSPDTVSTLNRVRNHPRNLTLAVDLSLVLELSLVRAYSLVRDYLYEFSLARIDSFSYALNFSLDSALNFSQPELKHALDALNKELPIVDQNLDNYRTWWQSNGYAWTKKLRSLMIQHRNIGHDWQFSDVQQKQLDQYFQANQLLVDCLKSECYVSRGVRQQIEDTLLLPVNPSDRQCLSLSE